ncbi:MAG: Pvc16 family protein [Lachnospiraceae bacterium]|nr:Pvc16 family protein [Lachnospiraceae bacterium]
MADYTAIFETGNAIVEMFRDALTPEPVSKREMISLCSPYESDNNALTVHLVHFEEDRQNGMPTFRPVGIDRMEMEPTQLFAYFIITAHSKAPLQVREADTYRILGAAIQAIADSPIMDKKYLTGSIAAEDTNLFINVENYDMERMQKIWNNPQVAYKASFVVKVSGININSKRSKKISRVMSTEISLEQKGQI